MKIGGLVVRRLLVHVTDRSSRKARIPVVTGSHAFELELTQNAGFQVLGEHPLIAAFEVSIDAMDGIDCTVKLTFSRSSCLHVRSGV